MNQRISEVVKLKPLGPKGVVLHLLNIVWIENDFVVNDLVVKHTEEMGGINISGTLIQYRNVHLLVIYC